jgi:hypothetical protein
VLSEALGHIDDYEILHKTSPMRLPLCTRSTILPIHPVKTDRAGQKQYRQQDEYTLAPIYRPPFKANIADLQRINIDTCDRR